MFLDRARPEYTAEERANRAAQAERFIRDEFFNSVLEEAETQVIASWMAASDTETRERARALLAALHLIPETLLGIMQDGPISTEKH